MKQSSGRIDRLNTPFKDLYYYHLKSRSGIDLAISRTLKEKKDFNATGYAKRYTFTPEALPKAAQKGEFNEGKADTILVSFDYTHGDIPVLIVGRKDKGEIDIINAFKGDEAKELYQKLTMKKGEV